MVVVLSVGMVVCCAFLAFIGCYIEILIGDYWLHSYMGCVYFQ